MHRLLRPKIIGLFIITLLSVLTITIAGSSTTTKDNNFTLFFICLLIFLAFLVIGFIFIKMWDIRNSVVSIFGNEVEQEMHGHQFALAEGRIKTDRSGKIIYINTVAAELTGWNKTEALNELVDNVFKISSEKSVKPIISTLSRIFFSRKSNVIEKRTVLKSKDQSLHYIINSSESLIDEKGNLTGAMHRFNKINSVPGNVDPALFDKNYWNLVEQASDAIMVTDMAGNIIKVNESFYRLLNYCPSDIKGFSASSLYCSKDLAKDPLDFEYVSKGKSLVRERDMLDKAGNKIAVEINVKMINGNRLLAIIRDIRERKIANEAICKSSERFELIGRATNDALWEWDLLTGQLWANQVHQELYDLTIDQPVPSDDEWKKRLHPGDKEAVLESINTVLLSDKNTWCGEYRMLVNKSWKYIYGQTYIVRNENGEPIKLVGNMSDITARKNAEEESRLAIERYDILAHATSDTIWDWDVEEDTMQYNDGIYKMFGYKLGVENVFDWWKEKLHPDDFNSIKRKVSEVFENKTERFQLSYRFRCADGSYKNIYDRAFVIFDKESKPCRVIGAMQDVTYQVQEEARMGKAIMDAQEQERQYIGAELHDNVNQILAGALLVLGMVKGNQTKPSEILDYVEKSKGYINNAINEVRKLSHELAPASFDESTLKDAFENLTMAFNVDCRYLVRMNFDDGCNKLPEEIQINLYRILQEQMKNIARHAEATEIGISLTQVGAVALMIIGDNGKGFDMKTSKKGIGLGNIKKRAALLSGRCNIQSAEGEGCKVSVEIPIDITVV